MLFRSELETQISELENQISEFQQQRNELEDQINECNQRIKNIGYGISEAEREKMRKIRESKLDEYYELCTIISATENTINGLKPIGDELAI